MKRAIDQISASVTRARHKLRDHIDSWAIADDGLEITRSTTELCALVEYAVRGFGTFERARIMLSCSTPMSVFIDTSRVERVISRFVDLALSASQPGHHISVSVEKHPTRAAV